jgi:magnesium-transporting ATPase (P-type)
VADDSFYDGYGTARFLINGFTKGNWGEAFFFALAVAVGLTPEMLPMIVSVSLSGAPS